MKNNIIIYVSKDGEIKVDVNIQNEDIWISQEVMANLYNTTKNNISMHLKNIFDEGELQKDSVVKKFLTAANDGKNYNVFDRLNPHKDNFLKSCEYRRTRANEHCLHIEKPFDFKRPDDINMADISKLRNPSDLRWHKDITIRSNEKVANISNQDWCIPHYQAPNQNLTFDIYKNGKEPADVVKTIESCTNGVESQSFKYKAGKVSSAKEVPVEFDKQGLTSQQLADMRELFGIK